MIEIVNKIPEFINDYLKYLHDNILVIVGHYYLGEKYDLSILENSSIRKLYLT